MNQNEVNTLQQQVRYLTNKISELEGGVKIYRYLEASNGSQYGTYLNMIVQDDNFVPLYGYAVIEYQGSKNLYLKTKNAGGTVYAQDLGEFPKKGDKGDKGDKGNKGDQGNKGDRGFKGEQGVAGASFNNLTSLDTTPYEIAKRDVGDITEITTSIDITSGDTVKTADFKFEIPKAAGKKQYLHNISITVGPDGDYFVGYLKIINEQATPYTYFSDAPEYQKHIITCCGALYQTGDVTAYVFGSLNNGKVVTFRAPNWTFMDQVGTHDVQWWNHENWSITDSVYEL